MSILQELERTIISPSKLQADGIPSASIAILQDGKISAHVITTGNEDSNTVYQACSISKAITGLAVAKLVDQGRMSYDTKVIDHLPQDVIDSLVDNETSHLLEQVTVGMLLSHTSGLSQHGFPGYPSTSPQPTTKDILAGRYPANTPRVRFLTYPGMYWKYSGGGITLLQLVLENITGQEFNNLMSETVLKPLDMTRSWYGELPTDEKNYTNGWYTGYTPSETGHHHLIESAAAGLWTTPTDLLKASLAVQNSLHNANSRHEFLTPSTAIKMLTIVAEAEHATTRHMAMGWFANDACFSHTGDNEPGYSSFLLAFHGGAVNTAHPNESNTAMKRNGFAIMTNSAVGHSAGIWSIMDAIFYLAKWPSYRSLSSQFGEDEWIPYAAPEGTAVDAGWQDWAGTWDQDWKIVDESGSPGLAWKSFPVMRLKSAASAMWQPGQGRREYVFVVDGLPIRVRLTWKGDEKVIQMRQKSEKTLRRT